MLSVHIEPPRVYLHVKTDNLVDSYLLFPCILDISLSVSDYGLCSHNSLTCLDPIADIASPSFLGDYNQRSWVHWAISLSELVPLFPGVIEVTFTDFDIGCTYGTRLEIYTSEFNAGRTLCNLNKPIVSIKSSNQNVFIRYLQNLNKQRILEVFSATYRVTYIDSPLEERMENIEISSMFYFYHNV